MKTTMVLWALVLIVQNMSFTWVSRARNSGSLAWHALASVFSNGVWFLAFVFTFDYLKQVNATGDWLLAVGVGAVYIVATVTGSVLAHHVLRRFFETGKRKVGHYEEQSARLDRLEAALGLKVQGVDR